LKYKGLKGAAMAFMGDGAVNQGAVHEAYNLAALWNFAGRFCDREQRLFNGDQPGSIFRRRARQARRGLRYAVGANATATTFTRSVPAWINFSPSPASKSRPSTVEIDTYRYRGHSVADPDNTYRSKSEIEEYRRTKDPIQVFQHLLVTEGVLDDALVEKNRYRSSRRSRQTPRLSRKQAPSRLPDDIQKDVYWETDNPAQRKSEGRLFFD